jgi:uncharacterized protein YjgD (DUF1641 family)
MQPVTAEVQQLFDIGQDPQDKQRLLGGAVNVLQCPHCGFQGSLGTPIVYHDPAKELLLTYFPPEMNKSMEEQERAIGPMIQRVTDNLPQEQRKAYLLKPQQMFTYQTLVETILQADGITKEMIEAQEKRMDLIRRLVATTAETLEAVIKQEADLVDADFFTLFNRILQSTLSAQDEEGIQKLGAIQDALLEQTEFGRQLRQQAEEIEAARATLSEAGDQLTREKLLDILMEAAEQEVRLNALVSLARGGLDYEFFQILSGRLEAAEGDEKDQLTKLREDLLEITKGIDEQLQARLGAAQQNLEALLEAENPVEALAQNPGLLDDFFIQVLNQALAKAQQEDNQERLARLTPIVQLIQQLITPGSNPELMEALMDAPDDAARNQIVNDHADEISPQFIESLSAMMMQLEDSEDTELAEKVKAAYRAVLKASMRRGMQAPDAQS